MGAVDEYPAGPAADVSAHAPDPELSFAPRIRPETPALPPAAAEAALSTDDLLRQVLTQGKSLAEDFALKLKYDQSKDKTIDALTEEMRRHRAGLHFALIRPFLADLVSLHDDLIQLAGAEGGGDPEVCRTFGNLAATVEELLARQGVSKFALPHNAFESRQQRASRTTPTDQPELVGTVATHLRPGFMYDDRIVRPEHVAVYVQGPRAQASPVTSTPE